MELKIKPRKPLSEVLAKAEGKPPPQKPERKIDEFKVRVNEVKRVKTVQARDFLIHIEKEPDLSVTERYRAMGLSAYMGNRIQKELVETGYIVEVRRGKSIYLELTDKGREAIDSPKKRMAGKGSIEHQSYQSRIKQYHEDLGYNAYIEKSLNGKSIDVLVLKAGRRVAIEIELNITDHIVENISRDFTVGVDEVLVVTKKELLGRIKERVEKGISSADMKKISFEVLDGFG
jgi:predicted transcriptional regulator